MSYRVCIIRVSTGETRIAEQDLDWDDSSYFWWTEGNFGCDCNRSMEFHRAADEPTDDNDETCGHTRYHVPWAEVNGERIVIDA